MITVRRRFLVEVVVGKQGVATVQLLAGAVTDAYLNTNEASNKVELEYGTNKNVE